MISKIDNKVIIENTSGIQVDYATVEEIQEGTSDKLINVKNLIESGLLPADLENSPQQTMIPNFEKITTLFTFEEDTYFATNVTILSIPTTSITANGWICFNVALTTIRNASNNVYYGIESLTLRNTTSTNASIYNLNYFGWNTLQTLVTDGDTPIFNFLMLPCTKGQAYIITPLYNTTILQGSTVSFIEGIED